MADEKESTPTVRSGSQRLLLFGMSSCFSGQQRQ